jgi:hypothetical protein
LKNYHFRKNEHGGIIPLQFIHKFFSFKPGPEIANSDPVIWLYITNINFVYWKAYFKFCLFCIRLLALQVATYQRLHGALPMDENIDLLESKGLTDVQADRVADGLEVLAMALATIRDDEPDPSLQ